MHGRRLLALSVLAIALGCQDQKSPTAPAAAKAPPDPSAIISDGAHGGNPDFFFLPPMVSNPVNDPNYEAGKFNSALQPSLTVEICLLQASPVNAQGLPVATDCVAGAAPVKKFPAGTVRLQGAPDGHYQVLWNTRESNLDVTKYYRIKVLIEGSQIPLGIADVDPMTNKSQWQNSRTGEVIALIDDSTLTSSSASRRAPCARERTSALRRQSRTTTRMATSKSFDSNCARRVMSSTVPSE